VTVASATVQLADVVDVLSSSGSPPSPTTAAARGWNDMVALHEDSRGDC
jgi:hypothetical protein